MKPVPHQILALLLLALCGLCGWQWHRESQLRALVIAQQQDLATLAVARDELHTRVKQADAEVLRLTASLAELRANSVAKTVHDEALLANTQLRETLTRQNAAIAQQNERLLQQNAVIKQANESLEKRITERDDLARRLNEATALYNKLAKAQSAPP